MYQFLLLNKKKQVLLVDLLKIQRLFANARKFFEIVTMWTDSKITVTNSCNNEPDLPIFKILWLEKITTLANLSFQLG